MLIGRQRFKTLTAQDVETLGKAKLLSSKTQIPDGLGIDNASKVFTLFGVIVGILCDVLKGEKVKPWNEVTKAISAFIKNRSIFKDSGIVWDEMRDLQEGEREILAQLLVDSLDFDLDLTDPTTASIVNNAVRGIIDLTTLAVSVNT